MSDSEKPEGDLSEADGVRTDSDGNPHLVMEALEKSGKSDNAEELQREVDDDE